MATCRELVCWALFIGAHVNQNLYHPPSDFALNSFQELIYQPLNRLSDHLDNLDAFRATLLLDLAPMRSLEAFKVENIIMIEWNTSKILI